MCVREREVLDEVFVAESKILFGVSSVSAVNPVCLLSEKHAHLFNLLLSFSTNSFPHAQVKTRAVKVYFVLLSIHPGTLSFRNSTVQYMFTCSCISTHLDSALALQYEGKQFKSGHINTL